MVRIYGWAEQGNQEVKILGYESSASSPIQASYPGCTVTVYLTGTLTPASIYSDDMGTPLANPFTLIPFNNGYWYFYVADGRYDVNFSGSGIVSPFTLSDISATSAGVTSLVAGSGI